MRKWLNKPYPFLLGDQSTRIKIGFFVLLFVFAFLAVFQPFHLKDAIEINIYLACGIYAVTSAVVAYVWVTAMVRMFPDYASEQTWTIGREFFMMVSVLLSISIANFFMGLIVELHPSNDGLGKMFVDDILHTFAIGIFPVMVITFTNYTVLLKRNLEGAEKNNLSLTDREPQILIEAPVVITLTSPTKNNDIEVDLDHLVYIMADGNYIEFHCEEKGEVKREIRRNTLNNIAEQLSDFSFVFRTHRAYMVNLNKIIETRGNAQGYQLKVEGTEVWVPVSRGNLNAFDEIVNQKPELLKQYLT